LDRGGAVNLPETFRKFADDYISFDQVLNPMSQRPDLHAFMLLDRLVPGSQDIVSHSTHDEFYLSFDPSALAAVATEEDIHDLVRCGVRYNEEYDALCMFT
jgi:hypothetical protein